MGSGPYAIYRQVDGGPGWTPGRHWQAEWHVPGPDPDSTARYPAAVAWLTELPGWTNLDFILVPDHRRRHGYGAALIRACRARWPGLVLSDPIGPEGEALAAALARDDPGFEPDWEGP